jgi:hypothetical protein
MISGSCSGTPVFSDQFQGNAKGGPGRLGMLAAAPDSAVMDKDVEDLEVLPAFANLAINASKLWSW